MNLVIDDLKKFLDMAKAEADNNLEIYLDANQIQDDNGKLMGEIIIQFISSKRGNNLVVFATNEGIKSVMTPPPMFVEALQYYLGEEAVKSFEEKINTLFEIQGNSLQSELEKAKKVFNEHGFTNIVDKVWSN